jgi:virginiamycin B lyase
MSVNVERPTLAQYTARKVRILEHRIPSVGSAPYICVEGPDRNLWFCESGSAKIGRFDPRSAAFIEFSLPTADATPIGITLGADGNL